MTLKFSRRAAIVLGILTPLAETIRRWHQLGQLQYLPAWLDDYILGAFLLYGAYRTGKDAKTGRRFLASAWGFVCGMGYSSFFMQLTRLHEDDPAPIPSVWVAVIKGVGLAIAVLALIGSLKQSPEEKA
ncbi:MAG: hypothetical protein WBV94_31045 [Blastocatellia bacterium]